ncbi:MAG: TIGR00725 family protein [Candidatus Lokiarchaeota archaeon]|nr:TIGR00725 family protein [Candidatus Lokiarchaeota archaeon]
MTKRTISVIGGSEVDSETIKIAYEVGAEIARRDIVLICGGMGGVMESACKGAKEMGGTTVGILPTDTREHGNQYLDIAIPTGLGYTRNFIVAKAADGVIAINGSAGTLSEMAIAWFSDIPIVALTISGGWAEKLAGKKIDHRREDIIFPANTAHEAVQAIFTANKWD